MAKRQKTDNKGYEAARDILHRKVFIHCLGGCGRYVAVNYSSVKVGKYCPDCKRETELIREHNRQPKKSRQQRERYQNDEEFRKRKVLRQREYRKEKREG